MQALAFAVALLAATGSAIAWPSPDQVCSATVHWHSLFWEQRRPPPDTAIVKAWIVTVVNGNRSQDASESPIIVDLSIVEVTHSGLPLRAGERVTAILNPICDAKHFGAKEIKLVGQLATVVLTMLPDGTSMLTGLRSGGR